MATGDIKGFKEVAGPVYTEQVLNCTGAEIDTGTELSKFATPKALADSTILAKKDANGNLAAINHIEGYSTIATAAGTTTLTVASKYLQFFTGTQAQTVVMPVCTTLVLGMQWLIVNNSTGLMTVNSSGSNAIVVLAAGTSAVLTCILASGTSAASWSADYNGARAATGKKLTINNTLTLSGTDGVTLTLPSTNATLARTDAGQTFNGAQTLAENAEIALDPVLSAAGKYTGITISGTAGTALAFGDLVHIAVADGRWELADANIITSVTGDARGMLGMCVLAASDAGATNILLVGNIRASTLPTMTVGAPLYVGETAGDVVVAQPTTANVCIRVVGFALSATDLYFNPSTDYITHT